MRVVSTCKDPAASSELTGDSGGWTTLLPGGSTDVPLEYLASEAPGSDSAAAWEFAYDVITDPRVVWTGFDCVVTPGHPLSAPATAPLPCLPDSD